MARPHKLATALGLALIASSAQAGDRTRDMYEMELLHEFLECGKPVLGICRGASGHISKA